MSIDVPASALPSRKRLQAILCLIAVGAGIYSILLYLEVSPNSFFFDLRFLSDMAHQMLPPNVALLWTKKAIFVSLIETLSMAFFATMVGGAVALALAFFAATNTTPHPVVRLFVRTLLAVKRSVPHLVIILILLVAVGIGPFAGALALIISTIGTFGKFFSDAIEHADKGTLESVQSVGSTRMQTIRFAVLPQVMPSFVGNLFYAFDQNLRLAIPLGVFGGGGIGFELEFARGLLHFHDVILYTILIVAMITVMERISDWVRKSILTQPMATAK
jgi:phosphonate transport system permease protein